MCTPSGTIPDPVVGQRLRVTMTDDPALVAGDVGTVTEVAPTCVIVTWDREAANRTGVALLRRLDRWEVVA